jgi:hypothetical protein
MRGFIASHVAYILSPSGLISAFAYFFAMVLLRLFTVCQIAKARKCESDTFMR